MKTIHWRILATAWAGLCAGVVMTNARTAAGPTDAFPRGAGVAVRVMDQQGPMRLAPAAADRLAEALPRVGLRAEGASAGWIATVGVAWDDVRPTAGAYRHRVKVTLAPAANGAGLKGFAVVVETPSRQPGAVAAFGCSVDLALRALATRWTPGGEIAIDNAPCRT